MNIYNYPELYIVLVSFIFLLIGGISDIKTHKVSNYIILTYLLAILPIIVKNSYNELSFVFLVLIWLLYLKDNTTIFLSTIPETNKLIGGADVKILTVFILAFPSISFVVNVFLLSIILSIPYIIRAMFVNLNTARMPYVALLFVAYTVYIVGITITM